MNSRIKPLRSMTNPYMTGHTLIVDGGLVAA
jgi:hypothetical protein